ncbi:hypothetical protein [Nonomuraea ceibae]|uniref:hypothetical protein n=1 Tax=Nonomuraea ceibae TaxID=1935170 RepID=UPI001C607EA8|nr:hypothetical protein [Nonomuraea ceibae]
MSGITSLPIALTCAQVDERGRWTSALIDETGEQDVERDATLLRRRVGENELMVGQRDGGVENMVRVVGRLLEACGLAASMTSAAAGRFYG